MPKNSFCEPAQADGPVQAGHEKDSCFVFPEIMIYSPHPASLEGRFATVTDVEVGCGGRAGLQHDPSCGRTALVRTAKSCGPDLPVLGSSRLRCSRIAPVTGARTPVPEESAK